MSSFVKPPEHYQSLVAVKEAAKEKVFLFPQMEKKMSRPNKRSKKIPRIDRYSFPLKWLELAWWRKWESQRFFFLGGGGVSACPVWILFEVCRLHRSEYCVASPYTLADRQRKYLSLEVIPCCIQFDKIPHWSVVDAVRKVRSKFGSSSVQCHCYF